MRQAPGFFVIVNVRKDAAVVLDLVACPRTPLNFLILTVASHPALLLSQENCACLIILIFDHGLVGSVKQEREVTPMIRQ
jgi:hypothetical protein